MTEQTRPEGPVDLEFPASPPGPELRPRRRRWPWVLLGVMLVLLVVTWVLPSLLGRSLLATFGRSAGLKAGQVGGPLWSPQAQDLSLSMPGLQVQAGSARASVAAVDPRSKTLQVNVWAKDAVVNFNLQEYLKRPKKKPMNMYGWRVLIRGLDVQNTRLNFNGTGVNVPDARLQLSPGENGAVVARGSTAHGDLTAVVRMPSGKGSYLLANALVVDLDADARVLNHYWAGVTAGRITGRYVVLDGPIQGDLKVTGGALQVPQAKFVTVTGIAGRAVQRGQNITLNLAGQGWDGPVTAEGGVDLTARHWTITADATPTLAGLAQALNTTGEGGVKLRVTAQGWSDVRVNGYAWGTGKLAGVPFSNGRAEYVFLKKSRQRAHKNEVAFSAETALGGSAQRLKGQWAFGRAGQASLVGDLGARPLKVQASIDAQNLVSLSGEGLGGPLSGTFALRGQQLQAELNPDYGGARAQVTLQGTPRDLRAVIRNGRAGPFPLAGTARYNAQGLQAALRGLQLNLNRQFKGNWTVQRLTGSGVTLDGQGQLDLLGGDLSGGLSARVTGVNGVLSGPLNVNYLKRRGSYRPGAQQLTWQGDTFTLKARDLRVLGGVQVNGDLNVTTALQAFGTLTARGQGYNLSLTGRGRTADVRGTAGGVTVVGQSELKSPYRTTARVQGADIQGVLTYQDGLRFTLNTAGQRAQGVIQGENWDAVGRVNLVALRPLVNLADLSGTLDLNLHGTGGTARVNAQVAGIAVTGDLKRVNGPINADLRAISAGVTARLRGQVYPSVQTSGTVSGVVGGTMQTLNTVLVGPYGSLQARISGRTGELGFSGVSLPAQGVNLSGTVTPKLALSGRWGELNVSYDGTQSLARVSGQQALTAFGENGLVSGQATLGSLQNGALRGEVNARGVLDGYTLTLDGPWRNLQVLLVNREGLHAQGRASLPQGRYDLRVRGPVAAGLSVDGRVQGSGLNPRGRINVLDAQGGTALVNLRGLTDFDLNATGLRIAGYPVVGQLQARNKVLQGTLRAGDITLTAAGGLVRASGVVAGQQVNASGRLTLPATISNVQLAVNGPYLRLAASGAPDDLRGTFTLKRQILGNDPWQLRLEEQTYPLSGSLTGLRAQVGGLLYQGGRWNGALSARYALAGRAGTLRLAGQGSALVALPAGPVQGRLQVLPALTGTVTADLAPFLGTVPSAFRREVTPGVLVARLSQYSAQLSLARTFYQAQAVNLNAQVGWRGSVTASGTLTQPGTRLPVRYDGKNLTIAGALLNARTLQPVLAGAQGSVKLDLTLPKLQVAQASGRAQVDIRAAGQRAQGQLNLRAGQLSADLTSDLAGRALRLAGPIYPQANAILTLDDLRATLTGNAETNLTLRASGAYQGRAVDVTAQAQRLTQPDAQVNVSGMLAGAALNLDLERGSGTGLTGWRVLGSLSTTDLKALAGTAGTLNAALSGTLADLRAQLSGEAAGVKFSVPARYQGGVLSMQGARGTLTQGHVQASGTLFPTLNLSAAATLTDFLPGQYSAQVTGTFSKPDVRVQGELRGAVSGLQAQGTRLSARLLGRDWRADLSGPRLSGPLRGQLGANALAGLLTAQLKLDTRYVSGSTDVKLQGQPAWSTRRGWQGGLRVVGGSSGEPLDALLDATPDGALDLAALIGLPGRQARVSGTLGAELPFRPSGSLTLAAFDIGALWQRPDELRLTGQASLSGANWSALSATFAGRSEDSLGDLTADVGLSYRQGETSLRLAGDHLAGGGTLSGGAYRLNLRAEPLRLARLLPPNLKVDALTFGGQLEARGTLADGPQLLTLRQVALRGQQRQVGPLSLYGQATYQLNLPGQPDILQADLRGSLRGGLLNVQGALPGGLKVQARGIEAEYPNAAALGTDGQLAADLTLTGALSDPRVQGQATLKGSSLDALLTLGGRLTDPQGHLRAALQGQASGVLHADLSGLDLKGGTLRTRVYGTVQSGENKADVNLSGVWPQLAGQLRATLAGVQTPVLIQGDGQGIYAVSGGELGGGTLKLTRSGGFLPQLTGTLVVKPLPLVQGSGELTVNAALSGPLNAPALAASLRSRGARAYGVALNDTVGSVGGPLAAGLRDLSGTLSQAGVPVAALQGQVLTLQGLSAQTAGSTVALSGPARLNGQTTLNVSARGNLSGQLLASYRARSLTLKGHLSGPSDFQADVDVAADPFTGWRGDLNVGGGPDGLLTRVADLKVSGPYAHPLVQGQAGLLGAGARLVATPEQVQLRLVDGPGASASGIATLRPDGSGQWRWQGALSLSRPELSLSLTPSGPLADPQVLLSLRRGEWRASGAASLKAADLRVSDGQRDGTLLWQGGQLSADLRGMNLAGLNLPDIGGTVSATGTLNTTSQSGSVEFQVQDLRQPYQIPYLGVTLGGDVQGRLMLDRGVPNVQLSAALEEGTLNLSASRPAGDWQGRLTGQLHRQQGTLDLAVSADPRGLTGTLGAQAFPLEVSGQTFNLDGQVKLGGQTFQADLNASNNYGQASVDAQGGLADLAPALENFLAVQPTEQGYSLRAALDDLDIGRLKLAPQLSGQVYGEATIRDGGGTFTLRSEGLKVGPKTLPARLEGTQVAGDWRIRGFLGESAFSTSEFTAGLSEGQVFGQGTLRALPVGALVSAVAGTIPGEGVVTGVVRFRFPLADPAAGSATVVAERIRVTATSGEGKDAMTEVLTGNGSLDLADREVRNVNIQLSGAGTWDVRGQYTREQVNLTAQFTNTTFTPVLQLIPSIAPYDPSLQGTVTLTAAGTYDRPRALLRAQNLQGRLAGLSLYVPEFTGELPDSGALSAQGRVQTGGLVTSDGMLKVTSQVNLRRPEQTVAEYQGVVSPKYLGALPNTTGTLRQEGERRWVLSAQSVTSNATTGNGTLTVQGDLAPHWDLTLTARNYDLPMSRIYGRESAVNADLKAVDDGTLVRVSGAADVQRLILGRSNAPAVLPPAGQSTSTESTPASGRTTDNYVSPLPPEYTTFPVTTSDGNQVTPQLSRSFQSRLLFEDIPIRFPNGIRVDENLVRADFSSDGLVVSGTGTHPRLSGVIRSQRGFIYLRENEFTLQDGSLVTFSGESAYPKFDLTATGTVRASTTGQNVPVTLRLKGEYVLRDDGLLALNLNTTLSCTVQDASCSSSTTSIVPYTEAQLYALVATGVPDLTALPGELGSLGASALQTALNVFVLGEVERTLAKAFNLDVFRLTPSLADGTLGATFTFGSRLTRDLYLQYQVDLTGKGLIDATYNTPDNRFTFKVSTPITGLNLQTLQPSFSAAYNISPRASLSLGVRSSDVSTKISFGVNYRF